jgi:Immunity protein Imm1
VHIQDLQQEHEVSTLEEFERVLAQRYGNEVNGFWINRRRNLLPLLLILVNKAYAYMLYSPMKTATRLSLGGTPSRHDPDHDTIFFANRIEEPEVFPNFAVIALADAIAAAKQLFASTALPRCVEWFEP